MFPFKFNQNLENVARTNKWKRNRSKATPTSLFLNFKYLYKSLLNFFYFCSMSLMFHRINLSQFHWIQLWSDGSQYECWQRIPDSKFNFFGFVWSGWFWFSSFQQESINFAVHVIKNWQFKEKLMEYTYHLFRYLGILHFDTKWEKHL